MKLTIFSRVKPRGFNYIPIHYDPAQEAREQRRKELLGEDAASPLEGGKEGKDYVPGEFIRSGGIRRTTSGISSRLAEGNRTSSLRGAIALGGLLALSMWLLVGPRAALITLGAVVAVVVFIVRSGKRKR